MRYRGFVITSTPDSGIEHYDTEKGRNVIHEGYYCQVYAGNDDQYGNPIDSFCLAVGYEIPDDSYSSLERGIIAYVDNMHPELYSDKLEAEYERSSTLVGRLVSWLNENESGEELYNTLSEVIGMTDDEIREIGFTSLVPYFNREAYAQTIAEYLIDEGTESTYSGNLHIPFEEINNRYAVDLPADKEMLDMIRDALLGHGDILSDLETIEDFDMMFYTMYCPNVEDESIGEDNNELPKFIPEM